MCIGAARRHASANTCTHIIMSLVCCTVTRPHINASASYMLQQFWRSKLGWWASELDSRGMKGTQIKLLEAHKVYDETLADQFLIMAGRPRGPVSWWYVSHKHAERLHSSQ